MSEKDLNTRFEEAVAFASEMSQSSLPQDVQLRLYANYKQATFGTIQYQNSNFDLRNAFKTNAWMQISHLTPDEAKENYIEIISSILNKKI
ncbi:acyl-CoA-binding protein [Flavobacterium sp.]|uniref:acyl-CoA-binding protein n=1 Tax=Flavobacterium sp. TaxID=239 RepID=UPI00260E22FB|nr:acyl-CoA-binding protein [Flavobacterium sp.]MDD3005089.1 acyl-CoA-binding protein [Flavobacterium sp.]